MKVRAKTCFSGMITMAAGEVRDIEDNFILDDLLRAGYVELMEAASEENKGEEAGLLTERLDKAQLEEMTVPKLKELAKQLGLDDSGKKADLVERIAVEEVSAEDEESEPVTEGGAA